MVAWIKVPVDVKIRASTTTSEVRALQSSKLSSRSNLHHYGRQGRSTTAATVKEVKTPEAVKIEALDAIKVKI